MKVSKRLVPLILGAAYWPQVWFEQRTRERLGGGGSLWLERAPPPPTPPPRGSRCGLLIAALYLGVQFFLAHMQKPWSVKGDITACWSQNHFRSIPGLWAKGGLMSAARKDFFQHWKEQLGGKLEGRFLFCSPPSLPHFSWEQSLVLQCPWML